MSTMRRYNCGNLYQRYCLLRETFKLLPNMYCKQRHGQPNKLCQCRI